MSGCSKKNLKCCSKETSCVLFGRNEMKIIDKEMLTLWWCNISWWVRRSFFLPVWESNGNSIFYCLIDDYECLVTYWRLFTWTKLQLLKTRGWLLGLSSNDWHLPIDCSYVFFDDCPLKNRLKAPKGQCGISLMREATQNYDVIELCKLCTPKMHCRKVSENTNNFFLPHNLTMLQKANKPPKDHSDGLRKQMAKQTTKIDCYGER